MVTALCNHSSYPWDCWSIDKNMSFKELVVSSIPACETAPRKLGARASFSFGDFAKLLFCIASAAIQACLSVWAFERLRVWAFECLSVWAFEHLSVWAFERLSVWAFERLSVWAFERLSVWAFERLSVWAFEHLSVWAFERLSVWVFECLSVWAFERLSVWAFERLSACYLVIFRTCVASRPAVPILTTPVAIPRRGSHLWTT